MKLKVVCQVCGVVKEIDTQVPDEWRCYFLGEFGLEDLSSLHEDRRIWICKKCLDTYGKEPSELKEIVAWSLFGNTDLKPQMCKRCGRVQHVIYTVSDSLWEKVCDSIGWNTNDTLCIECFAEIAGYIDLTKFGVIDNLVELKRLW